MAYSPTKRDLFRQSFGLVGVAFASSMPYKIFSDSDKNVTPDIQFINDEKCLVVDGWVFPATDIRPKAGQSYAA